jgi:hypothetical protein
VELVEPANERDNGWNRDWNRLCTYQKSLYALYKSDSLTAGIPVLGPSFACTSESALQFGSACSGVQDVVDMGNLHAYSGLYPESPQAGGWGIGLPDAINRYRKVCGDKPIFDGESGYKMSGGLSGHPCISQRAAAKYSLRHVLVRIINGVNRIYFYQLINDGEDFGLLNDDGSPRKQFIALRNFIALMSDTGEAFEPEELIYTLEGDLGNVHHILFQKRDKTFMLILWQGVNGSSGDNWNHTNDINNPDRALTLKFQKSFKHANTYRPSFETSAEGGNGIKPVEELENVSTIDLKVPDHILVVEVYDIKEAGNPVPSKRHMKKTARMGGPAVKRLSIGKNAGGIVITIPGPKPGSSMAPAMKPALFDLRGIRY